ncbi:MAG: hypothetical protein EXS38_08965 [Opitutus sp.]|nr:hypothetical protein [Opitutus sp.]
MAAALSPRALWWLLVALTIGWFGSFALWPDLFFCVGVNHLGVWFLDTFAILASNDALTLGRDPYAPNVLDHLNRPHVYSHWWLHLREVGLTRAHNFGVGLAVVGAFLATALAGLRPRAPGELLWCGVVFLASPVVLAVDRANNDLVVFVLLAAVVPCLMSPVAWVRFLAVAPIAVAAGLKFYPAIAGVVLLAAPGGRERRGLVLLGVGLLALVGWSVGPGLAQFGAIAPKAEGLMTFGAVNLLAPIGLGGGRAMAVGLALTVVVVAGFLRSRIFAGWVVAPEHRAAWLGFILGAALLTGCFFTGTNYAYRWIFAVWMVPLLWWLPRDPAAPSGVRRLAGLTAGLLVFVLWSDAVASAVLARFMGRVSAPQLVGWADRFFLIEQPIVWGFFFCLLGFLGHFAREGIRGLSDRN